MECKVYSPSGSACWSKFDVNHAMPCKKSGFIYYRHNNIRDFFAKLLNEVCNDIRMESPLQPLTEEHLSKILNTTNKARLGHRSTRFLAQDAACIFRRKDFQPICKTPPEHRLVVTLCNLDVAE